MGGTGGTIPLIPPQITSPLIPTAFLSKHFGFLFSGSIPYLSLPERRKRNHKNSSRKITVSRA